MASRVPKHCAGVAGAAALLFAAALAGCDASRVEPGDDSAVLRVAVLPDQERDLLRQRYQPLVDYLGSTIGRRAELVVPSSYADHLESFNAGEVDVAWFGGLTFAQAQRFSGADPLVTRDVDVRFMTVFLAAADSPRRSIGEHRGAVFSFGPRLSTSGHVMPRFFLSQDGIDAEEFFGEVRYSSRHDETASWVRDGVVSLGAINATIVASMLADGRLGPEEVRIIASTPPYQDYVWATRRGMDPATRSELLDAFLALDPADSDHARLLASVDSAGFLPASDADFDRLRLAASSLGLLGDAPD